MTNELDDVPKILPPQLVNGLELVMTCAVAPEQYDVYFGGSAVGYVRLRNGNFTVEATVGKPVLLAKLSTNQSDCFADDARMAYLLVAADAIRRHMLSLDTQSIVDANLTTRETALPVDTNDLHLLMFAVRKEWKRIAGDCQSISAFVNRKLSADRSILPRQLSCLTFEEIAEQLDPWVSSKLDYEYLYNRLRDAYMTIKKDYEPKPLELTEEPTSERDSD